MNQLDTFISNEPSLDPNKKCLESEEIEPNNPSESSSNKHKSVESDGVDPTSLEVDPGLRRQIWDYSPNEQDEICWAYLCMILYQPILSTCPLSKRYAHPRRFQRSWYHHFKWLEYSPVNGKAFCKPCFIFNKPSDCANRVTFTVSGFDSWKYVRSGKGCSFMGHEGGIDSPHHIAENPCLDLMNQKQYLSRLIDTYTTDEIASNCVRLKSLVVLIQIFVLQGIPFRGHDERPTLSNRGNFLEFLNVSAIYNKELSTAKAQGLKNAKYIAHDIQKQILNVLSEREKNVIRKEIGNSKYCVLVDEACDESKREQMSIVLRFVDNKGLIQECFFGLVHVPDTTSLTLNDGLYSVLAHDE